MRCAKAVAGPEGVARAWLGLNSVLEYRKLQADEAVVKVYRSDTS
jgi:hypothetical protein